MLTLIDAACARGSRIIKRLSAAAALLLLLSPTLLEASPEEGGGEANLRLPDLSSVNFLGIDGQKLLLFGILMCIFGLLFGMTIFMRLKSLPVHRAMRDTDSSRCALLRERGVKIASPVRCIPTRIKDFGGPRPLHLT